MKAKDKSPSKRISIVSIKMVREASVLYDIRKIDSPKDGAELGKRFLDDADREQLIVCCLDTKNQPTAINVVSVGSLNSSIVQYKRGFQTCNSKQFSFNNTISQSPSGDPASSKEDILITERIKESGNILGIKLIDHIIIGDDSYCSLNIRRIS